MNKDEWIKKCGTKRWYRKAHKLLDIWRSENNIQDTCVIHHRNDSEECRKYNEEHYELWGFEICNNGSYSFIPGKYVEFMTQADHTRYHNKGRIFTAETRAKIGESRKNYDNPMLGKKHTLESRKKMSDARKGRKLSEEHKQKIREANKNYSQETREKISKKSREYMQACAEIYKKYKQQGGQLCWLEFRKALASNEINIEQIIKDEKNDEIS